MNRLTHRFLFVPLLASFVVLGTGSMAVAKDGDREEKERRSDSGNNSHGNHGQSSSGSGKSGSGNGGSTSQPNSNSTPISTSAASSTVTPDSQSKKGSRSELRVPPASANPAESNKQSNVKQQESAVPKVNNASSSVSSSSLNQNDARDAVQSGKVRKLKEVISIVKTSAPGSIVSVKLRDNGNNLVYDIKVLSNNQRVKTVSVNASTLSIY